MVNGIRFMSPELAALHRAVVWAWRERRGVQAWCRGCRPELKRHYMAFADGRVRSAVANLLDVTETSS